MSLRVLQVGQGWLESLKHALAYPALLFLWALPWSICSVMGTWSRTEATMFPPNVTARVVVLARHETVSTRDAL